MNRYLHCTCTNQIVGLGLLERRHLHALEQCGRAETENNVTDVSAKDLEFFTNEPVSGTSLADRLAQGKINACAEACQFGATVAGDRDALLKEARARLAAEPGNYIQKIYGEHEVGGTSVLVLSSIPFDAMGFPDNLPSEPLPLLTFAVLSKIPPIVGAGAAVLSALWWLTRRKEQVALTEAPMKPETVSLDEGGRR